MHIRKHSARYKFFNSNMSNIIAKVGLNLTNSVELNYTHRCIIIFRNHLDEKTQITNDKHKRVGENHYW